MSYRPQVKADSNGTTQDLPIDAETVQGKTPVFTTTNQTIKGVKTYDAPTNISGSEQTTTKFKTSNGGAIILGKEAANSGTMIRLDQSDGTCRLRFRSSATAGAMVWEQPEQGAQLYIDLGKNGADKHRIQFPSSAGTLALKSQIPTVNNGTLTIQKNGTNVQTFTANQSGNVTANIIVPTKTSELTNDSGFLTSHQSLANYATKTDLENYLPLSGGTLTGNLSGKYITGTWLQTTAANDLGKAPTKYGVIDNSGWLYTRTLAETKSDLGIPTKTSELTNDSGYLSNVAITSSSSGTKNVGGKAGTVPEDLGDGAVYKLRGTENIGLGATNVTITPNRLTKSATGSYNASTGDYSWTLTTAAKGGIVAGTIKWSGGDDQLKVTKNGSESVVGYFNKINGQSIVALDSPKNFELLQSSSFQDFINSPFPWIDDAGSYDAWSYLIRDELGFIDTPHPTYYLHTIRAFHSGSSGSYIVFSVISTQSTAYTQSTLYSAFPDKGFQASGYYSAATKASNRVNAVYPRSATTIQFDYGNNSTITTNYGGIYFADEVRKIA